MASGGGVDSIVAVQWRWLGVPCLRVLAALRHGCKCTLGRSIRLGLSSLGPLLAQSFCLLLLLSARSRRPIQRARLEIHGRNERAGIFLLRDEGVQFGLMR